ncbi:MAG: heparinase II/III family protein [Armatimonadota bacterium]
MNSLTGLQSTWAVVMLVATGVSAVLYGAPAHGYYADSSERPRLLCTPAELDQVRARLHSSYEQIAYQRLLEKCDAYLDPESSHYVNWPERVNMVRHQGGEVNYWETRPGAWILTKRYEELAWAGVLSGDEKYIEGAKNIVMTIIRERVIDGIGGSNYGRDYGGWLSQPLDAGHSSRALAVFYDLLYDHLTEQERQEIREYIVDTYLAYLYEYMQSVPDRRDYPGILGHNMHLIGNAAGGLLALAVYGETGLPAEREDAWVELFFDGVHRGLEIGLGEDGGGLEGPGYASASLYYGSFLIEAMRRAGGPDLLSGQSGPIQHSPYYYLYEMRPNGQYFNNINDAGFSAHTVFLPLFASVLDDPALTWLWDTVEGHRHDDSNVFGDTWRSWTAVLPYVILWRGLAPNAMSPDQLDFPLSRHFARRGLVSMRTSWEQDGVLFSFLSGGQPDRGHSQFDANHFALYAGDSILAYDPGYGAKGTQSHNTLLFDGQGQSVRCTEGRISAHEPGHEAAYVRGSAGDLYDNPALRLFDRHVYFVRGEHGPYAVMYDEVEANGEAHTYTWLLNIPDSASFDLSGQTPLVVDEPSGWEMQVTLFAAGELEFGEGTSEYQRSRISDVTTNQQLRAELTTAEPPAFLALLHPRRADDVRPQVERVSAHALQVTWPGYTDLVAFGPAQTAQASTDDVGFVRTPTEASR